MSASPWAAPPFSWRPLCFVWMLPKRRRGLHGYECSVNSHDLERTVTVSAMPGSGRDVEMGALTTAKPGWVDRVDLIGVDLDALRRKGEPYVRTYWLAKLLLSA